MSLVSTRGRDRQIQYGSLECEDITWEIAVSDEGNVIRDEIKVQHAKAKAIWKDRTFQVLVGAVLCCTLLPFAVISHISRDEWSDLSLSMDVKPTCSGSCYNRKLKEADALARRAMKQLHGTSDDTAFMLNNYAKFVGNVLSQVTTSLENTKTQKVDLKQKSLSSPLSNNMEKIHHEIKAAMESLESDVKTHQEVETKPKYPPRGCEVTVQIIRHCEKDVLEDHCDYQGFERAQFLTTLFGNSSRWPVPSELYALDAHRYSSHNYKPTSLRKVNWREVETLLPCKYFDIF